MASPDSTRNRCSQCGDEYPAETLVCPNCRNILAPQSARKRTPGWVIALLVAVIAVLLVYIVYLIYNTLVLRQF